MKNHTTIKKAALCLFGIIMSCMAQAQTIRGYVTDIQTGQVVEDAVVMIMSSNETFYYEVGYDGFYVFDLYSGTYTLVCNKSGYDTFVMKDISINYDEYKTIDIKLSPKTETPAQEQPAVRQAEAKQESIKTGRQKESRQYPVYAHEFIHNPAFGIHAGYSIGEIGNLAGGIELSLSRLIGGKAANSNIFLSLQGGYQKESYKSELFNQSDTVYEFSFLRASAGLHKIIVIKNILITPQLNAGFEQAKPISENIHELVDNDMLKAFFIKPSISLGYAIKPALIIDITANYYAMMKDVTNKDNKILAKFNKETKTWEPWSYDGDFFKNRKGPSVSLGIKYYF